MISLKCENCGGKLKRDESQVIVTNNAIIIRAGCDFECQFCGSKFVAGTEHQPGGGGSQIAIGSNIAQASGGGVAVVQGVAAGAGGIAIGGSVRGDIVVGRKVVEIER